MRNGPTSAVAIVIFGAFAVAFMPPKGVNAAIGMVAGHDAEFWKTNSVIIAEVVSTKKGNAGMGSDRIRLRPLGTIAGTFDVARHHQIEASTTFAMAFGIEEPPQGAIVGAVVTINDGLAPKFEIAADEDFMFVPGHPGLSPPGVGLQRIYGSTDVWIGDALSSIQKVHPKTKFLEPQAEKVGRFMIYAQVTDIKRLNEGSYKIGLSPKLTLSGEFDIGGTPEIVVTTSAEKSGPAAPLPRVGARVIVAVVRNGGSFSVEPGRPEFMPGDHAPICVVTGVSDPKLAETRKALQALYKEEADEKAKAAEKPR